MEAASLSQGKGSQVSNEGSRARAGYPEGNQKSLFALQADRDARQAAIL